MDAFDLFYIIRMDLDLMLDIHLDLTMFTESKQLFNAVICGNRTQERRLGIDLSAARQIYRGK